MFCFILPKLEYGHNPMPSIPSTEVFRNTFDFPIWELFSLIEGIPQEIIIKTLFKNTEYNNLLIYLLKKVIK